MSSTDTSNAKEPIVSAIVRYLAVLGEQEGATLHDLAKSLDALVLAYHGSPSVEPDTIDEPRAPRVDEKLIIESISTAFPDLGWYALVEPDGDHDQEVVLSISSSDLAEIAVDLLEVLWLFEHASHNDAIWAFRFGYRSHWGRHLHELRTYLHALAAW